MSAHARLGSSNHRWPNCAGSVALEERYPDIPGDAAIDGTGTHLLLEKCLENDSFAESYIGELIGVNSEDKPSGWLIDVERANRVDACLNYIDRRITELEKQFPDAEVFVKSESKVDIGGMWGRTDYWGTVDVIIEVLDKGQCLFIEVIDYKDGRGWVDEKDNTQLLSYMIGAQRAYIASGPEKVRPFHFSKIPSCRVTIVQPKTNPTIRYQDLTHTDIEEATTKLEQASDATDNPMAALTPGDWCQWCKANPKRGGNCGALTEQSLNTVKKMGNDIIATDGNSLFQLIDQVMSDVKTLTPDQLSELATAKDGLVAAFNKVEEEIQSRIETGITVPGYAMKPGRSSKVWNESEEVIVKALKGRRLKQADIYPPKLISPAQMLKCENLTEDQKKSLSDKYITVKAGAMKLTKVEHGKEDNFLLKDVEQNATVMFQDVPTKEEPISFF